MLGEHGHRGVPPLGHLHCVVEVCVTQPEDRAVGVPIEQQPVDTDKLREPADLPARAT